MEKYRSLILRGNRFLGAALIQAELANEDDVDAANQRLLERLQQGDYRQPSLIQTLIYEMEVLREEQYIDYQVEKNSAGLIDLVRCDLRKFDEVDPDLCSVTLSIPFDRMGDHVLIASACMMSRPICKEWEALFGGKVFFFATSLASISHGKEFLTSGLDREVSAS